MREVSVPEGAGRTPFGIAVGIGATVMVAAAALSAALFPPVDMAARLAVVSVAVGVCAATTADTWASLVTAGLGYLLFCGFLVNRYGELTWDGTTSVWHVTVSPRRWRWGSRGDGSATPAPTLP